MPSRHSNFAEKTYDGAALAETALKATLDRPYVLCLAPPALRTSSGIPQHGIPCQEGYRGRSQSQGTYYRDEDVGRGFTEPFDKN